jgi:hypothetical protein
MRANIRYRDHAGENAARKEVVMFADVRVVVMGVEVSDYLTGDVSVVRNEGDTEGTCSFSLDNNYDRFIMRPENFGGETPKYNLKQSASPQDMGDNKVSGKPNEISRDNMRWIIDESDNGRSSFEYDERPKRDLFNYKIRQIMKFNNISNGAGVSQFSTAGSVVASSTQVVNTSSSGLSREMPCFNLTVGTCVLHVHDEVRVWFADPCVDPLNESEYRWAPLFSGVISSAPVKRNRVNGESSISVTCGDLRYLMKKMRIAGNIQSADQKKTLVQFDDPVGMFKDALPFADPAQGNVKFENILSDLSYRQLTRAIFCGDSPADIQARDQQIKSAGLAGNMLAAFGGGTDPWVDKLAYGESHQNDPKLQIRGIGTISLGYEIDYEPSASASSKVTILEDWNDLILFGAKFDWYTNDEVERISAGTRPINYLAHDDDGEGQPSPYSVLSTFVHYLFPEPYHVETFNIRNCLERALVTPGSDVSWNNRLEIIKQASDNIGYKFYISPIGDVIFEFPMFDFMPEAFGKYASCYVVGDSIKSDDQNDEGDGNVVTGLIVRGGFTAADAGSNAQLNETANNQAYSVIIKSDFMARKYSNVVEEYAIPWLDRVWELSTTDAAGNTIDKNALQRNALISFGIIEFFKRISAMSSMGFDGIYNPFWLPNRPILNKLLRRIGLTTSATISIPIDGAPTSSIDTYYIRAADHDNNFIGITGAPNTPFSYADGQRLALFSALSLDNIRTTYGIEIIDPSTSMVENSNVGLTMSDLARFLSQGSVSTGNNNVHQYSVSKAVARSYARYDDLQKTNPKLHALIAKAANNAGMDPHLLYQIMEFESGGRDHINPLGAYNKQNPAQGAQGVIQFMPDTLRGMGIDPVTFREKYPTVESQMPLVEQYLTQAKKSVGGNLDSPYTAYMAIFNPASAREDMNKPFANSDNKWTREHADKISRQNGGIQKPSDLMLKLGYNYDKPGGGQYSYVTQGRHGPVTVTQNYVATGNAAANNAASVAPPTSTVDTTRSVPGFKLNATVTDNAAAPTRQVATTRTEPLPSPTPVTPPSPKFMQASQSDMTRIKVGGV